MAFQHLHAPDARPASDDFAIAVSGGKLLVREAGEGVALPKCADLPAPVSHPLHVGLIGETACWLYPADATEANAEGGLSLSETRPLIPLMTEDTWSAVNCALTLYWWRKNHRYCGACGAENVEAREERVLRCPKCGALFYPTQSPAVIVAVTKGDAILLAHNRNFRGGIHSVIAGFVDPGETFEAAVARELMEEVGIEIHEPRYVASQSWPFPNSLMVGFRAEWKAGEPLPDGVELETAGWYGRDRLPELPGANSIARRLINEWLQA